jgi:hypothetical protein
VARRGEYRTWEELSASERRRGLVVLGGAATVAVGFVVWIYGGTVTVTPTGAPSPTTAGPAAARTPAISLAAFDAATASARQGVTAAETAVRGAIAQNNGQLLKPACALLADRAAGASGAGVATPAGAAGQAWAQGLRDYQQASHWCGELFDGTQVQVPVLLKNTSTSLDAGDAAWGNLAAPVAEATTPGGTSLAAAG